MSSKMRIKDIAEMAGVSPGTVDRVLHNRGDVSQASKEAVELAISKVNYHPNIHLSAISLKRKFKIVVAIPKSYKGEYWGGARDGILRAVEEYHNLNITCKFCYYNQFSLDSCRTTFETVIQLNPDAVIIGPTFKDETIVLANRLKDNNIPFVYIDSMVEGTLPLAFFSTNLFSCGYLMAKLIASITPADSDYVLFQAIRVGDESANTTIARKAGFMAYFDEHQMSDRVHRVSFSVLEPERNETLIKDYFEQNPNTRGVVVLNSRGYVISNYFKRHKIEHVKLICSDLTEKNEHEIKNGHIDFVLSQRPEMQGVSAMKTLIQHLTFGTVPKMENFMPLDIITKENLDYYVETCETSTSFR
ncbi:MAG TPA: substrate-binding domain-containing protein [Bacteroidales bacterium]|nr:substrate-binding domain-containing protein [Bacteroidales bacterium]